ncbi:hypothetical protein A6K25_15655 [Alteromonas stellipolaris]|uniref:DUF2069 domain-containing protein n=1 Tax=Alteromonas stellipolaris TaxID=233316 RepID=UPI0007B44D73|nr:DUF2069 domain-containing protein [Alteromonas stellipolaris]ANB22577.1 hypothetical protein A6K25_15655 [Alteromonas stellipolaris]
MAPNTRFYRYLALGCHTLLIAWIIAWQFLLNKTLTYSPIFITLVYLVPLLLPYKGIIQGKPYTHAWANFVVLFYLMHGCTVAYAVPEERWYAAIEILLCVGMFVGCSAFARKRGRELGLGLKKLKQVMQEEKAHFEQGE